MIQERLTSEIIIDINATIEIVKSKNIEWKTAASIVFNDQSKNIKMFKENQQQIRYTEFYYHNELKEGVFDIKRNTEYLLYMFYKLAKLINNQNILEK
jgi:hypothetical protein